MRSGDRNHASYVRSGGESKDLYMASKKEMHLPCSSFDNREGIVHA